jgi:hypothetical protein
MFRILCTSHAGSIVSLYASGQNTALSGSMPAGAIPRSFGRLIERLSHGPASVHGLTEPFAPSQQMISKHIAYLVRARIVIKTKRGRESVGTLRPESIRTVSDRATNYRRFWEESFDKLDVVVYQMKKAEVRNDKKHG